MTAKEKAQRYAREMHVIIECQKHMRVLWEKRPLKLDRKPTIKANHRFETCGGRATYSKNLIELNTEMLYQNQDQIEQVIVHEYSHLVAKDIDKKRGSGHGPLWRYIMKDFGYEPDIYHKMEPIRRRKKASRMPIRCSCMIHWVTPRKYKMIKMAPSYYSCKHCRSLLG